MLVPIHRFTQSHYAHAIYERLGKGKRHAALLYSEYYKTGQVVGADPAFNNAGKLLQDILALTDFTLPPVSRTLQEGSTIKFLLDVGGLDSESVIIPMQAGPTLCVSSQIGCARGCAFCETGKMGLIRSLTPEEIVAQLVVARRLGHPIRNVVFMGMGEPMDNLDAVLSAIAVITDQGGLAMGPSAITVSTVGHVEGIDRLAREADPALNLAVSVNSPNDAVRNRIMPVNRRWDMGALKGAMERYCQHPRRTILIEYVLLDGITDSLTAADQLADYLEGLRVKVNVIPYNPQRKDRFAPPPLDRMEAFVAHLRARGYQTLLRLPKGQPIMAACGQLGGRKRPSPATV